MKKYYTLQLNAKVQPMDKGEIFEDTLMEILEKEGIGMIDGGGTLLGDEPGTIEYCDIEISLGMRKVKSKRIQKITSNFLKNIYTKDIYFYYLIS